MSNSNGTFSNIQASSPTDVVPADTGGHGDHFVFRSYGYETSCHGFWHDAALILPSVMFVVYLGFHAKKNLKKLTHRRSYVMIGYYGLLWFASLLNLAWCFFQVWQCTPGKQVAWNLLSLFATSGMLCLEISLITFLLKKNYASSLETLGHTFMVSGLLVGVDFLLKVIFIFGLGIPLFLNVETTHRGRWGILFTHKLLLTAAYGYILFVHFSKWRDKMPPRLAFYNYIIVMFVTTAVVLFACAFAGIGASFGIWLYDLAVACYHTLYLPFLYLTILADFFKEEDWLLDNAYYSEMKDAGFFDADWE